MSIASLGPGGLYIHIPFCRKKCLYCDFFSGGAAIADWQALTRSLSRELYLRRDELPATLQSVYIGGGTPSMMPPQLLTLLTEEIWKLRPRRMVREFTIEVNPEDVSISNITAWKEMGVNRISMGIQSLNDDELHFLQRNHSADQAIKSAAMLSDNFQNVSFDIMFGIPNQTISSLKDTLEILLSLQPSHISAYSLMYEEGTPLTALRNLGRIKEVPEDMSFEMFRFISDRLESAGFEQYEISNYARPGFRSLHNSSYWNFSPYLGIGPSAHSYDGQSIRRANPADLKSYLKGEGLPFFEKESLSESERMEEYIMLRLRTREGIQLSDFAHRFGDSALQTLLYHSSLSLKSGSLILSENDHKAESLALSKNGIMMADSIILSLL